ncbi:MAG TPA: sigma-70 family RNA polymerase sigma factor [Puia sp.]|nr:sigma-70 family RNA polymerase sigma factor [Puia sp.]
MKRDNQNDILCWLQFKEGNKEAFAEIYHAHIESLICYGTRLCTDKEILKDNIQDLFVELWNSRENLCVPDCVKFYLFKALRYKLIHTERQRHIHVQLHLEEEDENRSAFSVEDEIINKEIHDWRVNAVRKAITTLTRRQQEAIQLRFYQGFSNSQIAELMEMNYQSVSNLLQSALHRIKSNFKPSTVFTAALIAAFHLFL